MSTRKTWFQPFHLSWGWPGEGLGWGQGGYSVCACPQQDRSLWAGEIPGSLISSQNEGELSSNQRCPVIEWVSLGNRSGLPLPRCFSGFLLNLAFTLH